MTISDSPFTLYHNPRCSKSRGAEILLSARGIEFSVVSYLDEPPSANKLMELSAKGGFPVTDLVRFGEALAKELGITKTMQHDDFQWCELLSQNPSLIERPIFETEKGAVIGRPPERVLTLLE